MSDDTKEIAKHSLIVGLVMLLISGCIALGASSDECLTDICDAIVEIQS